MIIITGATGFVGRRLVKSIIKNFDKREILCLVKDPDIPSQKRGFEVIKQLGLKIRRVDLVTGEGLKNLPKSPRLIIHLAANTDTSKSDQRCNDVGTVNLVKALSPLGPENHFIHISTMVALSGRKNYSTPLDENSLLQPTNEYGRSKKRGEDFLVLQCKTDNFRLTILRPNTIYGSEMRSDSLFDFLKGLVVKKSFFSKLNWPGLSSLIHVDDVVKAIIMTAKNPPSPGKSDVYILHGEHLTLAQMSVLVHKTLGYKYQEIRLPVWFWKICAIARNLVPPLEKFLPTPIYNLLWRASIIVDNVTYCKATKIARKFPNWKPKLLANEIKSVVN